MFGIIVISLRRIEKPAVLLKNDDIRYSLQDSLHQDSPSMKALVGSRQPSTIWEDESWGQRRQDSSTTSRAPSENSVVSQLPHQEKQAEMAEKTCNSISLFCWGRLCNVVFHACLNSLNMSEWWLVVHHLKVSKSICSDHWQPEDSSPRPTSSSQPPDLGSRETFSAVQKPGPFAIAKRHTKHLSWKTLSILDSFGARGKSSFFRKCKKKAIGLLWSLSNMLPLVSF